MSDPVTYRFRVHSPSATLIVCAALVEWKAVFHVQPELTDRFCFTVYSRTVFEMVKQLAAGCFPITHS